MIKPLHLYIAGGALALAAVVWLMQKGKAEQLGAAAGGAVVGAAMGVVAGVNDALGIPRTADVIDAANNPDINPLQPVGAWLGGTIYDLTHW